jgi:hypothetical protein
LWSSARHHRAPPPAIAGGEPSRANPSSPVAPQSIRLGEEVTSVTLVWPETSPTARKSPASTSLAPSHVFGWVGLRWAEAALWP